MTSGVVWAEGHREFDMTAIWTRTVELSGLAFCYREAGDAEAPPLVLLHALGKSAADWDGVVPALAERHRVLALDQRGHGESVRPGEYSFELMRDDLLRFVDVLRLGPFSLIGHSMGGTVAFLFAEEWPERIERLVIEDTPPPRGPGTMPEVPDEPSAPVPFDWRLLRPMLRQLNEPDPRWWERLPAITAPTLLLGGGPTSHVPQAMLGEVARAMPDCRLVTIDGAGHDIHGSRPEEFLEPVLLFLDGGATRPA
jgi:esterase